MAKKKSIAALIGRFQNTDLHPGHHALVCAALAEHEEVVIFVGVRRGRPDNRNPLDFETRRVMLRGSYGTVSIIPLKDIGNDKAWSKQVDEALARINEGRELPVVLFGGRDSFIPHYLGTHATREFDFGIIAAATTDRDEAGHTIRDSPDFRAGAIYAEHQRAPNVYPTVDIAVLREVNDEPEILLGRKPGQEHWVFPGGFTDPTDNSYEDAARRELREETGIHAITLHFCTSRRIRDARYEGTKDAIMTSLYLTYSWTGTPAGNDNLEEVKFFKLNEVRSVIAAHHAPLLDYLEEHR